MTFRFSPRQNRAHEIDWAQWGPDAFARAASDDRPILLHLTAGWCHWCHVMDETTLSEPDVITLINESLLPIRVDTDEQPHVRDRYMAGGWPTTAFLTPTGEVLWAGAALDVEEFRRAARSVLDAWSTRREELRSEVAKRGRALEAAAAQRSSAGIVRREAGDDVLAAIQDMFDPRNGGFGTEPKFPACDAVDLLFSEGRRQRNSDWTAMAVRTLDGMLAGELFDAPEGGFFRYALGADWTRPQHEKLLADNARMLRAYAIGCHYRDRADWRDAVERTVAWADAALAREDGLWGNAQDADADYYALSGDERARSGSPERDLRAFTDVNAVWAGALAEAGGRLGQEKWVGRARATLETLIERALGEDGLVAHRADGEEGPRGLLEDALELAHACLSVAQATGESHWIDCARRIAAVLQERYLAQDGAFFDRPERKDELGALRYRDRPFEQNASAARLFQELGMATGERGKRAVAERTFALLSPRAGRYGVAAASFALSVAEFFEPPLQVIVVGAPKKSAALRKAALALALPGRRVWTLAEGGTVGGHGLPSEPSPAAYVCVGGTRSEPVTEPKQLADVAARAA